jgi:hypothetical protein
VGLVEFCESRQRAGGQQGIDRNVAVAGTWRCADGEEKSQSDPLYHLSHGQRGSDGFLNEPVTWLGTPSRKSQANTAFRRTAAAVVS